MKHTKLHPTLSVIDTWLLHHVFALLSYAKSDADFAESLAFHVQSRNWHTNTHSQPAKISPHLIPATQADALLTAQWLLQTLDNNPTTKTTRGILSNWAQHYESPKDLIFGIVGMAIIGPTLGIITNKKKKRAKLQVVINKNWYQQQSTVSLLKLSQDVSMKVIKKELQLAGGNAYQLHPDTAAWCLEEPLTDIYLADQAELQSLKTDATDNHLHYEEVVIKGEITALAISPTVNDLFVSEFALEKIK